MLVIHIGFAKTGTTFLQKQVFPRIPHSHYLGLIDPTDAVATEWDKMAIAVCGASDADLDEMGSGIVSRMRAGPNIMSNEGLLRPYHVERGADRLRHITRGIDVKIVMTIRKQEDIIWSRFVHDRIRTKHFFSAYSLEQAFKPGGECAWPYCRRAGSLVSCMCVKTGIKVIPVEFYDYRRIFSIYAGVFGAANVNVIPLESFSDIDLFCARLERAVGVEIDGTTRAAIANAPRENASDVPAELKAEKAATLARLDIMGRYRASNEELDGALHLGLGQYGYL